MLEHRFSPAARQIFECAVRQHRPLVPERLSVAREKCIAAAWRSDFETEVAGESNTRRLLLSHPQCAVAIPLFQCDGSPLTHWIALDFCPHESGRWIELYPTFELELQIGNCTNRDADSFQQRLADFLDQLLHLCLPENLKRFKGELPDPLIREAGAQGIAWYSKEELQRRRNIE